MQLCALICQLSSSEGTGHIQAPLALSGVDDLQGVCHRDLKLENTLLDGKTAPRLKICDFGYSKVQLLPCGTLFMASR